MEWKIRTKEKYPAQKSSSNISSFKSESKMNRESYELLRKMELDDASGKNGIIQRVCSSIIDKIYSTQKKSNYLFEKWMELFLF